MKLYHILWRDTDGMNLEEHIALPDISDNEILQSKVEEWLVNKEREFSDGFSADNITFFDVFPCSGVQDINGNWYTVTFEKIRSYNIAHTEALNRKTLDR